MPLVQVHFYRKNNLLLFILQSSVISKGIKLVINLFVTDVINVDVGDVILLFQLLFFASVITVSSSGGSNSCI